MLRAPVIATLLLVGGRADADVRWFGMSTTEALVPGVGVGMRVAHGGNALALDSSIVALPICLGGCELLYGVGFSLAYQRQITDTVFVGVRAGTRYWNSEDGWTNSGYLEAGKERCSGAWTVTGAVGAGVSVWPGGGLSPALALRVTVGR